MKLAGLVMLIAPVGAFVSSSFRSSKSLNAALRLTPDEVRASAVANYLTRAHEEKLRAIREVEAKKGQEIIALKQQIDELKSQSGGVRNMALTTSTPYTPATASALFSRPPTTGLLTTSADLSSLSKEELVNLVLQYQRFMADYIVKAQEQKLSAVRVAIAALRKQFEDRLQLPPPPNVPSTLYDARSVKVAAAAAAGKSRWGDAEVQRVNIGASILNMRASAGTTTIVNGATGTMMPSVPVPPEVAAADHGLRSDGSVGGWTLAERVAFGASVAGGYSAEAVSMSETLYQRRNAQLLAAAAAGKSRWGSAEIERVQGFGSLPPGRR